MKIKEESQPPQEVFERRRGWGWSVQILLLSISLSYLFISVLFISAGLFLNNTFWFRLIFSRTILDPTSNPGGKRLGFNRPLFFSLIIQGGFEGEGGGLNPLLSYHYQLYERIFRKLLLNILYGKDFGQLSEIRGLECLFFIISK